MQAETQEVQRRKASNTANQSKREKRHHRGHRIRQNFLEENVAVPHSQHLGGLHIGHAAQLQEFRTHVVAERNPVESGHDQNQQPETAPVNAPDQNHHVEHRQRRPNFDKTLHARIPELAEIPLDTTDDNPKESPENRQKQAKADANAKTVNQARKYIATVAVCPEPMIRTRCKRRRSIFTQVGLQRVMSDRRHHRPIIRAATRTRKAFGGIFFAFLNSREQFCVILFRLVFPTKIFFAIAHECREIGLAFVSQEKRFIVHRPRARERKQVRHHQHHQRPERPLVLAEPLQTVQGLCRYTEFHLCGI